MGYRLRDPLCTHRLYWYAMQHRPKEANLNHGDVRKKHTHTHTHAVEKEINWNSQSRWWWKNFMKINSFPFRKSLWTRYNVLCTVSVLPSITLNEIKTKKTRSCRAVPSRVGLECSCSCLPPKFLTIPMQTKQAWTAITRAQVAATAGLEF